MPALDKIDSRLAVSGVFNREDIVLHDPRNDPFTLYGVFYDENCYRRLPREVAASVSEGVYTLSSYTAGGRVAFKTDADAIAISCKRPDLWVMPHMSMLGSAGFELDMRNDEGALVYAASFLPTNDKKGYDSIVSTFSKGKMREYVLHFPLYCAISELSIGIPEGARLEKWDGYKHEKPIVFYGSSITQGGCASTPGGDYVSRLSRRFDTNYINLGFSGSAKAEDRMMDYLAGLDMSIFVYDYDHNAPSYDHLRATHYKGYKTIREKNPTLPIVMCSMPTYDRISGGAHGRRDIIAETYARALAEGDKNVYFVDGKVHYADFNASGASVDGTHPNDYGFFRMAKAVGDTIAEFWKG